MRRVLLASAIGRRPASSEFKQLLSSAAKYGLTLGNEKSPEILLTELGTSIAKPRDPAERVAALRRAAVQPDLFRRIYEHYNDGKLPDGQFFLSVLERDFNVPHDRAEECAQFAAANGEFVGIIREVQGSRYVLLDAATGETGAKERAAAESAEGEATDLGETATLAIAGGQQLPPEPTPAPSERFIFIAHGKNKKPLEQLEKVLKQFGILYKVAIYEPEMARPISEKVAQTMRECHSAILIFTADEQFKTADDDVIWRPSQNVIYELGAASILYQNRVVIFKEEKLDFPTDFRDIGHISFETDRLDAKGVDLIKELIALGLVKVQAA
jgi:predicted nucleotide-binding protein